MYGPEKCDETIETSSNESSTWRRIESINFGGDANSTRQCHWNIDFYGIRIEWSRNAWEGCSAIRLVYSLFGQRMQNIIMWFISEIGDYIFPSNNYFYSLILLSNLC